MHRMMTECWCGDPGQRPTFQMLIRSVEVARDNLDTWGRSHRSSRAFVALMQTNESDHAGPTASLMQPRRHKWCEDFRNTTPDSKEHSRLPLNIALFFLILHSIFKFLKNVFYKIFWYWMHVYCPPFFLYFHRLGFNMSYQQHGVINKVILPSVECSIHFESVDIKKKIKKAWRHFTEAVLMTPHLKCIFTLLSVCGKEMKTTFFWRTFYYSNWIKAIRGIIKCTENVVIYLAHLFLFDFFNWLSFSESLFLVTQ